MKKHIGTLLMVVGVLIIIVPLVGRYIATRQQEALLEAYYLEETNITVDESDYAALNEVLDAQSEALNYDEAGNLVASEAFEVEETNEDDENERVVDSTAGLKAQSKALGIVRIPKIDVVMPIAEGTTSQVLKYNVGHVVGTAALGEIGNSAIAGHRGHSFGTYFYRLDEIVIGDEIIIETKGKSYTYTVYETLRVLPDDLSVLRGSSSHRVITLITCDPVIKSTHRLIVHAVHKE